MKPQIPIRFQSGASLTGLAMMVALSAFSFATAHAQGIWHHDIAGKANTISSPLASIVDKKGDIVATGLVGNDNNFPPDPETLATIAYDRNGHKLWEHDQQVTFNRYSDIRSAAFASLDSAGNTVFLVETDDANFVEPLLLKFNPSGKVLVDKSLDFSEFDETFYIYGVAFDAAHGDNLYLVAQGYNYGSGAGPSISDGVLAKYDSSGNQVWRKEAATGLDYIDLAIDTTGNLILAGDDAPAAIDKRDSNGNLIFRYSEPTNTFFNAVTTDSSDNIYIAGTENSASDPNAFNLVTEKVTANGAEVWSANYGAPEEIESRGQSNSSQKIIVDSSGDVILGGVTLATSPSATDLTPMFTLVKYDAATGTQDWAYRYSEGFTLADNILGLYSDADDNIYAVDWDQVAHITPFTETGKLVEISRKLASDGTVVYRHNYDGSPNELDEAFGTAAAFDPAIDGLYALGDADFLPNDPKITERDWYIVAYQP